ncbi:UNVERIFIED_CONTAM: hypothetical protein RMT77_005294 [Armadillidium vulgare]
MQYPSSIQNSDSASEHMTSRSTSALVGHAWAWRIRIFFYILLIHFSTVEGYPIGSKKNISFNFNTTFYDGVCPSFLISEVSRFQRLSECQVIEGYLQIGYIPKSEDLRDLTFPLLKEIKDFLLISDVEAHLNLTHMFPNLAVIRGEDILSQYAVIIFRTPNLVQSRLPSLKVIVRGFVYIVTQNCSDSSEYYQVIQSGYNIDNNKIMSNRSENCRQCARGIVPKSGPYGLSCDETSSCTDECPEVCRGECALKSSCCSPKCLGGCQRSDVTGEMECIGCKYFRRKQKCVLNCNETEYKLSIQNQSR